MNKILSTTTIAIGIGAAAFGVSAIGPVAAQTASNPPASESSAPPDVQHRGIHHRLRARCIREAARVAADKIGVSVTDLRDAVRSGQSVADVANSHNVNPDDVKTAIVDDFTAKIDAAVQNGKLSADRAAKLKERLPNAVDRFMSFTPDR